MKTTPALMRAMPPDLPLVMVEGVEHLLLEYIKTRHREIDPNLIVRQSATAPPPTASAAVVSAIVT